MRVLPFARSQEQPEFIPGIWERKASYFQLHPIGEILRGFVYTTVLWGLLTIGVYTVYSMVIGLN
ncbi:MAG TPA: hypothetical protein VGB69_06265 [Edaphobacter sp.]